jgi:hypothetical protein
MSSRCVDPGGGCAVGSALAYIELLADLLDVCDA